MNKLIYIASFYTECPDKGVDLQINATHTIMEMNKDSPIQLIPYAPLLNHYVNEKHPHEYDEWIDLCLAMVKKADAVLVTGGEASTRSPGVGREVITALKADIPVAFSYGQLGQIREGWNPQPAVPPAMGLGFPHAPIGCGPS